MGCNKRFRPWTKAEDAALLALCNQLTHSEIAKVVGRTRNATSQRIYRLRKLQLEWFDEAGLGERDRGPR